MEISIAIPVYAMGNKGLEMLKRCLESIRTQTLKPFEVVITDNSVGEYQVQMKKLALSFKDLNVKYFVNPKKGITINTNETIKKCRGELIKILYQDDYFAHPEALQIISDNFTPTTQWLVTGCHNNLIPRYTEDIHLGNNKIGAPSVLTIRNEMPLLFDEKLSWLFDCDYYRRMYEAYGEPCFIYDVNVKIGIGDHQMTNILSDEIKNKELAIMKERYV